MTKSIFITLIIVSIAFQNCVTYKRSFGKTYTVTTTNEKLYRLDLSQQNLKEIPLDLSRMVDLRMLNLSGNTSLNIEKTLENIPNPKQLEVLILDDLNLKSLSKSILRFSNLKHLSLNSNPNLDFNKTIGLLKPLPLNFLNIQHNNLTTLPIEITAITKLNGINISHNKISNPETFKFLGELPKLRSLWLTHNHLDNLPKEIGLLATLKNLYIEHNNLTTLPNAVGLLRKVLVVHMGHNKFTHLPTQLIKMPNLILLHVNNCMIKEISEDFATTKYSMVSIILDNNNLSLVDKEKWKKRFSHFFISSF